VRDLERIGRCLISGPLHKSVGEGGGGKGGGCGGQSWRYTGRVWGDRRNKGSRPIQVLTLAMVSLMICMVLTSATVSPMPMLKPCCSSQ